MTADQQKAVRYYHQTNDSWVCSGPGGCGATVNDLPAHDHKHGSQHSHRCSLCAVPASEEKPK